MTPRERLQCVLAGFMPDRVPVSPFVQETYLAWYFRMTGPDRLIDGKRCAEELDFDLMARINRYELPPFVKKSAPNWELSTEDRIENGILKRIFSIRTPEKTLTQVEAAPYEPDKLTGIHFATLKYLIEGEDDFEVFRKYLPPMDKEYAGELKEYAAFAKKHIGERGVTVPWCCASAYNLASRYINLQDMMLDALTEEDYYAAYMELFTSICAKQLSLMLESDFDAVGFQGNIANGSIMGGDFFREQVMPYEQKLLSMAKQAGKPTVYHNCGCARNLYACYRDMDMTVWETISPAPQGDNVLAEAKAFFGDSLVLCGTLDQIRFLKTASPDEVRAAAREAVETGKPGGHYIFACSDYLEENTPPENVRAMIEAAKAAGRY